MGRISVTGIVVAVFAFVAVYSMMNRRSVELERDALQAELNQLKSADTLLRELSEVRVAPTREFATGFANLTRYYHGNVTLLCGEMRGAQSARIGFEEPQNATAEVLPTYIVDRDGRNIAIVVPGGGQ